MAIQLSVEVRNARLDVIEEEIGASAVLKIRSGTMPANCATADAGAALVTIELPGNWMVPAAAGAVHKSGNWQDLNADVTGTAGHFRLYASDGSTCHMQGTVTVTGGGGDMEVVSTSFIAGQRVRVTTFVLTDGNA